MAEQLQKDRTSSALPTQVVITDLAYLQDPGAALARMRHGIDVIVEPTNGCARMTLSASLVSDVQLDD